MHQADLDTPFDPSEWEELRSSLQSRCSDECPDLVPGLSALEDAQTCKDIVERSLELIASRRNCQPDDWIGLLETWTIDFFPALARSFPDSRFIFVTRDPRAMIASTLGMDRSDGTIPAQVLSLARHWRKMVTCYQAFSELPELRESMLLVKYEEIASDPEAWARRMSDFLGLPFDERLVDFENYVDPGTLKPWPGNSSFTSQLTSVDKTPIERWRQTLPEAAAAAIEFVCHADMANLGYTADRLPDELSLSSEALDFLITDCGRPAHWRTDFEDMQKDYGFEAARNMLLRSELPSLDSDLVRRCFLFESYFERLRGFGPKPETG